MIPTKEKNDFWAVVRDCLIQFHGLKPQAARDRCHDRRRKIESPPKGYSSDIFYHNEPFDIACELAGQDLNFSDFHVQYEKILASHQW